MPYTQAKAHIDKKGHIRLTPQQLCHVGCETPTMNYNKHGGRKYRYFYGITSDVDDEFNAGKIYKVNTWTGEVLLFEEEQLYCSEPQFVPNPGSTEEDDGVIISSAIRGSPDVNYSALVVLDAKTMREIGRAEFLLESPVPKSLHGFFTGNNLFH